MPGSAQNPWATELKTRKKSVPRKRSVNANGKKGNENTDDVCNISKLETDDDKNNEPNACGNERDEKKHKNSNSNNDLVKRKKVNESNLNVRPSTANENSNTNNNPTIIKTSTLSCDPFMSSNSSPCPCPSKLNSKSSPTGDDKMSHRSDNSSLTGDSGTTSPKLSSKTTKSKSPSKTGEKDKELSQTKKRNVPEKEKGRKMQEVKEVMNSENKGNNASKVNFKDEIKDIPISNKVKTNNKQKEGQNKEVKTNESDTRNMYEEARGKLKPTFDRQTSFSRKVSGGATSGNPDEDEEENPVERLIRQDSVETKTRKINPSAEAKKREFLVLNYPADVRRNLKGLSSFSFETDDNVSPGKLKNVASDNKNVNLSHKAKNDPSTVSTTNIKHDDKQKSTTKTRKESVKKGRNKSFCLLFQLSIAVCPDYKKKA